MYKILPLCVSLLLLFIVKLSMTNGAKILGVFTTPSRSHILPEIAIMKGLAAKGHNVTVVTIFPPEGHIDNYRHIFLNQNSNKTYVNILGVLMIDAEQKNNLFIQKYHIILSMLKHSNDTLNHSEMLKLMREESFDLLVLGWYRNDHQLGIAAHFQCPSILIQPQGPAQILRDYVGSPTGSSYTSNILLEYEPPMTFFQRFTSFLVDLADRILIIYTNYLQEKYYLSNFPADRYPSYNDVKKNISLILVNDHFTKGVVRPNQPAMVEVGGVQVKTKPEPLPEDLKKFLDAAVDGAILFSLGSNVKSAQLPSEKIQTILNVFSRLKQKIVWKWEDDYLPGKPENVFIGKWLPQEDVLAHPNMHLFISHSGISSVMEALYYAVPMLAIPLFSDQHFNAEHIMHEGWSLKYSYSDLGDGKKFHTYITELLTNSKYRITAKKSSELFRDRPMSPLDISVYWIEYVLRYNGAKHMQSPAVHLNVLQLYSLDVIALILLIIYITWKLCIYITKGAIYRFISKSYVRKEKNL